MSILSTATHRNHDCELSQLKFITTSASQDGPCFPVHHALRVEGLSAFDRYCPNRLYLSEWPHLKHLELPNISLDLNEVSVLIGQDVPQADIVLDYCWGDNPESELYATKAPFGWYVAGPTNQKEDNTKPVTLSVFEFNWTEEDPAMKLHQQVERVWASEAYGFGNAGDSSNSIEGESAPEILKSTTRLKNERDEVGLLWRNKNSGLPNNRPQAEKKLQQLKKLSQREPAFVDQYRVSDE